MVPHRPAGHGAELAQHLEVAAEDVVGLAGRDHPPADEATEGGHADEDPELVRVPETHGDLHVGLPQVELAELARAIGRALTRVGGHEQRAELGHPVAQHRHGVAPPHPLGDHGGRHVRELPQQLQDRRLHRVDHRARWCTLVARWLVGAHRRSHRVARQAQPAGDGLDAQALGSMEPTNLGPSHPR